MTPLHKLASGGCIVESDTIHIMCGETWQCDRLELQRFVMLKEYGLIEFAYTNGVDKVWVISDRGLTFINQNIAKMRFENE